MAISLTALALRICLPKYLPSFKCGIKKRAISVGVLKASPAGCTSRRINEVGVGPVPGPEFSYGMRQIFHHGRRRFEHRVLHIQRFEEFLGQRRASNVVPFSWASK